MEGKLALFCADDLLFMEFVLCSLWRLLGWRNFSVERDRSFGQGRTIKRCTNTGTTAGEQDLIREQLGKLDLGKVPVCLDPKLKPQASDDLPASLNHLRRWIGLPLRYNQDKAFIHRQPVRLKDSLFHENGGPHSEALG